MGRRNAITIASYMLGYEMHTPAVSRDYGSKQFCVDIKQVMQTAGIKGEHVILLVEDFQIIEESILEIVNSLISSGEVPGLYTHEELEPLLAPLRERMREEGGFRTPYEYFVARVKKFLHIVLCMDPGHSQVLLHSLCIIVQIARSTLLLPCLSWFLFILVSAYPGFCLSWFR